MDNTEQNIEENIFIPDIGAGLLSISEMLGQEYVDPLALPCCMALLFSTVVESKWCLRGVKVYGQKVGIAVVSETVSNTVFLPIAACLLKDLTGKVTGSLILLKRRIFVVCWSSPGSSSHLAAGLT